MPFRTRAGDQFAIDDVAYQIAEHPTSAALPHGQPGRQSVVYRVLDGDKASALKVFEPRYRFSSLISLTERISRFAGTAGLAVCNRRVLNNVNHKTLLRQHPGLSFAILMPWIEGPSWAQVMQEKRPLHAETCLTLAKLLTRVLTELEQRQLAHCELSGPNVMVPALEGGQGIELVDVEGMYGPELERPGEMLGAAPGYTHWTGPRGIWGMQGDRFAGAVLLAELLGWCDGQVREAAWGRSYFDPSEMQKRGSRYYTLVRALREHWGEGVIVLFERAWRSKNPWDCARFEEWSTLLPDLVPSSTSRPAAGIDDESALIAIEEEDPAVRSLMSLARRLDSQGQSAAALDTYREAQANARPGGKSAEMLSFIIWDLESRLAKDSEPSSEQNLVDRLFDNGLAAYQQRNWEEAVRLLDEVVWRSPNYRRGRKYAAQLLAKAQRREERAQRNGQVDWRWAAAVVLVLIGAGIVGPFAFGWISGRDRMAAMFQAATPTPRMPPEVTHILAPTTAPTSTPRPTSRPTNTPAPTSTPTPVPTLAPRVQYAPPPAPAPQLLGPEYGQYSNPIVFSWIGPQNQSYQVTLQHMDEEYVHYSGLIDGFSWTFDIPGTEWGNWQWYVTSSEGINSTVWSFTFNPLPPISAGE